MATHYRPPTNNMQVAFDEVRAFDCHRERLKDVAIALKSVVSEDKDGELSGDPLKRPGTNEPILGKISITSPEERSDSPVDVRVLLNGNRWGSLSKGMQNSVVDTCLTRIEVQLEDGQTKLDDLGRPVLKKRPWGYELVGFVEVDERHGVSSIGVHNMRVFFGEHGQGYMRWLDETPPDDFMRVPVRPPKRPKAAVKEGESDEYARGKLAAGRVAERLEQITERATVLGVLQLELATQRPRDKVIDAVRKKVLAWTCLPDFIAVEQGKDPSVAPDLAAAVLVTTKAQPEIDLLDRTVTECRDKLVLGWVLDDEGEEDPRNEVLEMVNRRLRELG